MRRYGQRDVYEGTERRKPEALDIQLTGAVTNAVQIAVVQTGLADHERRLTRLETSVDRLAYFVFATLLTAIMTFAGIIFEIFRPH